MDKTKVINIVGASGSGKTTVAKELEKMGCNIIQSYTTRPQREDGEWGHTFIEDCFVSYTPNNSIHYISEGLAANSKTYWAKDMIAYFNSYNSGHHYFATDEQVIRNMTNIYIVDSKGAEMVHNFYKGSNIEVITVYLQVDREVRNLRMINRCFDKLINEFEEVSERLSKDDKLFQIVKCDYVVNGNQDIDVVVDLVRDVI